MNGWVIAHKVKLKKEQKLFYIIKKGFLRKKSEQIKEKECFSKHRTVMAHIFYLSQNNSTSIHFTLIVFQAIRLESYLAYIGIHAETKSLSKLKLRSLQSAQCSPYCAVQHRLQAVGG